MSISSRILVFRKEKCMNVLQVLLILIMLLVFLGFLVYGLFLLAPWVGYVGLGLIGFTFTIIWAQVAEE